MGLVDELVVETTQLLTRAEVSNGGLMLNKLWNQCVVCFAH
jgi:hypothetical protein